MTRPRRGRPKPAARHAEAETRLVVIGDSDFASNAGSASRATATFPEHA